MKTSNIEPHGLHATAATRGQRSALLAGAKGMTWRDSSTESIGQIRDMTVVGLTFIDNEDGTGILTTGTGGTSGGGAGLGTPPWFNVVDYGATGDGTTVDCTAINDAIDDINAAGRGVLYFPPGTYLCNAGLNAITVPCAVIGEGRGSPSGAGPVTEIVCSHATANLFDVQDHVHFRDIQLRNSHATPTAGALIATTTTGTDSLSISGCLFRGGWMGVDFQEGGGQNIHDCWFTGQRKYSLKIRNISSPDGGDHAISNCWFYAFNSWTPDAAIRIESGGGAKITNCKINSLNASGNYVNGIDVAPSDTTSVLLIHGNSIENITGDGLHVVTSTDAYDLISVVANQFGLYSNSTGNCIEITCANIGEVDDVVIVGNMLKQNGGGTAAAINLTKVNNARIGSNVRNGFGSLLAQSGCTNITEDSSGGSVATDTIWDAAGDLAVGTGADTAAKLTLGASGKVPQSNGTTLAYVWPPGYQFGAALFTAGVNITATTEATANTIVTGPATAFDGSTNIYIEFYTPGARPRSDAAGQLDFWLYDDTGGGAASIGKIGFALTPAAAADQKPMLMRYFLTPSNATHTYSVRAAVSAGTGSVGAGAGGNGNVMPGYIRLFKH